MEYRLRRHDGEYRWISNKGAPHFSSDNNFIGYTGGCIDIHDQKVFPIELEKKVADRTKELNLANEALMKSEALYHNMVESVQDYAILFLNKDGIIENWNKGAEKIKGYKAEEIIGKNFNIFYSEQDKSIQLPETLLKEAQENGTAKHEGWRVRKDGSIFWGFIVITALFDTQKNIIGFSKVTRDLTDKKSAEDKIEEAHRLLRNKTNLLLEAQELASMGNWEWDLQENKIVWSDELYRILGLMPQEIESTYDNFLLYIHPDDKQMVADLLEQALENQLPYNFTHRIIRPDGNERILHARSKFFTNIDNNIIRMAGTEQDITEQKKYEAELKYSEERFLKIFNNNPTPMTITEIKTNKIKYANTLFYSIFGYAKEEVIDHTTEELQLLSDKENERIIKIIMHALQENRSIAELKKLSVEETEELLVKLKQADSIKNLEILYTKKNGNQFTALVSYETIGISHERYTITSYHDITERKKNEDLLKNQNVQLEKMNSELKSFTYISSHDLQEPLRKIQTFAGRILEKEYQNLSANAKDQFNRIQGAAQRMQTLIIDLLNYSRTSSVERIFEYTDLTKITQQVTEELIDDLETKHAIIEFGEMCSVNIIPFQFRQLLHNIISNSLKFSNPQHAPLIKIKSSISKGHSFDNQQLLPQTSYCHIRITDNGVGFEPQYNERIFEVFQRLHGREKYKGTGIGLAIVKKIIENHAGIITAHGELNIGATFDIYIPAE